MANITLNNQIANYDDSPCLSLNHGESITLNNSTIIINSDVRWSQNSAVIGIVSISSTQGGNFIIDGTETWFLPYQNGSGNVPNLSPYGVLNVSGLTSNAQGELLGVFQNTYGSPVTAGSAMPANGFIKLRRKIGNFANGENIIFSNGATATLNSTTGGFRGWIHVVFAEGALAAIPRLGKFICTGSFFQLGITDGSDNQTFNYPVPDNCPAILVETSPNSNQYEWWLNAGSRWGASPASIAMDERGKFFGCDNSTGIITIARRGSDSCGFKPQAGLRILIPNIIISMASSSDWNANVINATVSNRFTFDTSLGGEISIKNASGHWNFSFINPFRVTIEDSSVTGAPTISNVAEKVIIKNFAVGTNLDMQYQTLTISNVFTECQIEKFCGARSGINGANCMSISDSTNVLISSSSMIMYGQAINTPLRAGSNVNSLSLVRCKNVDLNNNIIIGGKVQISQCFDVNVINTTYADRISGNVNNSNNIYAIETQNSSDTIVISGFNFLVPNNQPYLGIASFANSFNIKMRNIGTTSSILNLGNNAGVIANASVTNGIQIQRVYTFNTRNVAFSFTNTVQNVDLINVWSDRTDVQNINFNISNIRGCGWTNTTTPQNAVYGSIWQDLFVSDTSGRIVLMMNEDLDSASTQVQVLSGNPRFTSAGTISMPSVGDSIQWTMPYFAIGHMGFENVAPTVTGTNTSNINLEYSIDTGSGFSSFKQLNATNLVAETINPSVGFKLRIRATTMIAGNNTISYIRINTITNATNCRLQYPMLDAPSVGLITNIVPDSRLQLYNLTNNQEIINQIVTSNSFSHEYVNGTNINVGDAIRVRLTYVSGTNARLPFEVTVIANSAGFSVVANQQIDNIYSSNGINGSTITEFIADYPNIHIDVNDPDNITTVQRIYAYYVNLIYSLDGIRNFHGAILALDEFNYEINTDKVNLRIDNLKTQPLLIIGGHIYRKDGTTVIASSSNSIQINPGKVYRLETEASGLNSQESAALSEIRSEIKKINLLL